MPEEEKDKYTELPYGLAETQLYLCDCHNVSSRVDPDYHAYQCSYRIWYYAALRNRNQTANKHDKDTGKE